MRPVECAQCRFMFSAANPRARYCSAGCRNAAWKARNNYRDHREPARSGPRSGANARSGLQVSFGRAVQQVEQLLRLNRYEAIEARETAESTIRAALSERQRRELDAR